MREHPIPLEGITQGRVLSLPEVVVRLKFHREFECENCEGHRSSGWKPLCWGVRNASAPSRSANACCSSCRKATNISTYAPIAVRPAARQSKPRHRFQSANSNSNDFNTGCRGHPCPRRCGTQAGSTFQYFALRLVAHAVEVAHRALEDFTHLVDSLLRGRLARDGSECCLDQALGRPANFCGVGIVRVTPSGPSLRAPPDSPHRFVLALEFGGAGVGYRVHALAFLRVRRNQPLIFEL